MKRPTMREVIAQTMLELLENKQIQDITVKEIAQEIGASTRTFYNNFLDKYDVCNYIYDSILDTHCWRREDGSRCTLSEFFENICRMIGCDYHRFFENTMCYHGQNSIHEHIVSRGIEDLKQQLVLTGHEDLITSESVELMTFYMRGLTSTVEYVMRNKRKLEYFLRWQDKTKYLPQELYDALSADPNEGIRV